MSLSMPNRRLCVNLNVTTACCADYNEAGKSSLPGVVGLRKAPLCVAVERENGCF